MINSTNIEFINLSNDEIVKRNIKDDNHYLTYDICLQYCRLYMSVFGHYPNPGDHMMIHRIRGGKILFNIYKFVNQTPFVKLQDIRNIFGKLTFPRLTVHDKVESCKKFYNDYQRIPKVDEMILSTTGKPFKIGKFVHNLDLICDKAVREELKALFHIE